MEAPRRHPDLFTAAEALEYLHLPPDSIGTLDSLRDRFKGFREAGRRIGKEYTYHRRDLDKLVDEIFGFTDHAEADPVRRGRPRRQHHHADDASRHPDAPKLKIATGGAV